MPFFVTNQTIIMMESQFKQFEIIQSWIARQFNWTKEISLWM